MPIYEYACTDCGYKIEVYRASMGKVLVLPRCPQCDGLVERKFSAPNIIVR